MKIALCFSGMLRTWDVCHPTIKQFVIEANPEHQFDSFISTWDVRGRNNTWWTVSTDMEPIQISSLFADGLNVRSVKVDRYYDSRLMRMVETEVSPGGRFEHYQGEGGAIKMPCNPRNVIPMVRKIEQSHNLMAEHVEYGNNYDIVVKIRTDLKFSGPMVFNPPQENTVFMPDHECWGPGSLNDQLVYGDVRTMTKHASLYSNLVPVFNVTKTLHPESLLHHWYIMNNIKVAKYGIPYLIER